ncbi:hypothetical protein HZS_4509 [Henneguya salminicola]|nr:hypothetical protein HZS_4509 [Henneguya salminicola]
MFFSSVTLKILFFVLVCILFAGTYFSDPVSSKKDIIKENLVPNNSNTIKKSIKIYLEFRERFLLDERQFLYQRKTIRTLNSLPDGRKLFSLYENPQILS